MRRPAGVRREANGTSQQIEGIRLVLIGMVAKNALENRPLAGDVQLGLQFLQNAAVMVAGVLKPDGPFSDAVALIE